MEIRTSEDWWLMLEEHKDSLRDLVATYHPIYARWCPSMEISAPRAQNACDKVCEEIEQYTIFREPIKAFDYLFNLKDRRLSQLLSETWFGLPESMKVRSLPGFHTLCDLCSESYVLFEGDEDECE